MEIVRTCPSGRVQKLSLPMPGTYADVRAQYPSQIHIQSRFPYGVDNRR